MPEVLDFIGAGEGNRTLVFSLEGCCSSDPGGTCMKRSLEALFELGSSGVARRSSISGVLQ